jgi:hypothetical protein
MIVKAPAMRHQENHLGDLVGNPEALPSGVLALVDHFDRLEVVEPR